MKSEYKTDFVLFFICMTFEKLNIDYTRYSFKDFLQDDYFIRSVRYPEEKTVAFWQAYLKRQPANEKAYRSAKSFLETLVREEEESAISTSEKQTLWKEIISINEGKKKARRQKILYFAGIGVAASLALLIIFMLPFLREGRFGLQEENILSFVEANKDTMQQESTTTQLLLSNKKIVTLEEEEAIITYDSSAIHTGEKQISKEEVASYNRLVVPKGKRSILTFSDGTKIWVNASTMLVYPAEFSSDKREIYVDGEIFLEVQPDKKRPFIVKTKEVDVQVFGTSFNVSAYESDPVMQVVLASGAVRVTSRETKAEHQLHPSEKYEYVQGLGTVKKVNVYPYISWKDGLYIYDSERLDAIFLRLSRYYGKDIVCDSSIAALQCSGKLDLKDSFETLLQDIAYAVPISYIEDGDGKIRVVKEKI